jgi:hypothetical protein
MEEALTPVETKAADALVALCSSVLSRGFTEEIDDPQVSVIVHVDEQVLTDASAPGCAHIEGTGAITGHAAQRLACDGAVSKIVFSSDGRIEQRGSTRVVPRAMRRALMARDKGCRWPGCTAKRFLHAHHVVFWAKGGPTCLSNLLTLCGAHHRFVHEGGWDLQLQPSGALKITSPDGACLPLVPRCQPAEGQDLAASHKQMGLDIGQETLRYGGERFDLGLTIDALLCVVGRNEPYPVGSRSGSAGD